MFPEVIPITIFIILEVSLGFILWRLLYRSSLRSTTILVLMVLLLLSLPYMFQLSNDIYNRYSKMVFKANESGEVQLNSSPLRIPENMKDEEASNYCKKFTDQNDKPINLTVHTQYGSYCGNIPDMNKEFMLIPFKIRADGKAEYWIDAQFRTIGEASQTNKQRN